MDTSEGLTNNNDETQPSNSNNNNSSSSSSSGPSESLSDEDKAQISGALGRLKEKLVTSKIGAKITDEHKELHAPISKLGKVIDKSFRGDLEKASKLDEFDHRIINQVISQHLYRQGLFEVGDTFSRSLAGVDLDEMERLKVPFKEMYSILQAMEKRDLRPAIAWAHNSRQKLAETASTLEFKLHKLEFITLMSSGQQSLALTYARQHFTEFATDHMHEIQHLMGSLIYASRLATSPYADMFKPDSQPSLWADTIHAFQADCCALMGMSEQSPLHVVITAGWKALPTFIKLASFHALQQRQAQVQAQAQAPAQPPTLPVPVPGSSLLSLSSTLAAPISGSSSASSASSTLPSASSSSSSSSSSSAPLEEPLATSTVEVDLGRDYQFHPIFACPVSREQSTKENPPVLLTCGHVISKASMLKLVKGPSSKLKCPYCPQEQLASQSRPIFF
eukprot:TRINITY_DN8358_c0_g1_i2.p1 TRINITY_DN8358_c0_g1~~TRINITY_DN8358_c0_g1_i2.p1  ORF type:complete len:509 (+),score=148.54 TRINITY_DN8358_c0_g1_i2:181-1527(+)